MKYPHLGELHSLVCQPQPLITQRKHPSLNLYVYNYNPAAMSLHPTEWPQALKDARGLVLDGSGDVIARGFEKFWNLDLQSLPNESFTVSKKFDGSLGIVFVYKGQLVVTTRGSFDSDQAKWATNWLRSGVYLWKEGLSYLFEIIYPENRIVVDYHGAEKMVLLAVLNLDGTDNLEEFKAWPYEKAEELEKYRFYNPKSLVHLEKEFPGEEGFVVRWESGVRAKVKFEEYKRLHRLLTQISSRSIWRMLRAGEPLQELFDRVPEDFRAWAAGCAEKLKETHRSIIAETKKLYWTGPCADRKTFAEWAKHTPQPHLMFALYNQRPIEDIVWKMIEPKWTTPFREEGDTI